uniref:Uncharacterized protein n=1 Tax=Podoviridae sp. ctdet19 TaxID=2825262 RepID=A0A8S5U7W8_9CAUD|nr:MAG TPA: hypothetical protein [Podoviridae sp. ctdet19]
MYHEIYDYCCSDTKCNVDCPEDGPGQTCPKFTPIRSSQLDLINKNRPDGHKERK